MESEKQTINILLDQLTQSKATALFLVTLSISIIGRMFIAWFWIFEYLFYCSIYFLFFLISIAFITAIHEREHITKLKELGYEAINFKVHRVGDVSFWFENIDRMSADEAYQNATSPFLKPLSYGSEIISILILIMINIDSPFPLSSLLLIFSLLAFIHLVGSFCVFFIIHSRKTSGFCVKLARTITSRGDIDEIVSWNKKTLYRVT